MTESAREEPPTTPAGDASAVDGATDQQHEPATGKGAQEAAQGKTVGAALGEITWLISQSPAHRHALFLADIEWLVMPPLTLGQYRLFYGDGKPLGVALWAYVSDTVEQRLAGGGRLGSADWRSGERLWLVELIAPFGQQEAMLEDLRSTALADRKFRFVRTQPNGRRETVELGGANTA